MSLLELLPGFYGASLETADLEGAIEPEIVRLWADRDGLFDQLTVETATWGLALWERDLGIVGAGDRPPEVRRHRILEKLRGRGPTRVALVKQISETFSGANVDVLEHPAQYTFEIRFSGTQGVPPGMADLDAVIREIRPAHLGYGYIFVYNDSARYFCGLAGQVGKIFKAQTDAPGTDYTVFTDETGGWLFDGDGMLLLSGKE